MPGKLAHQVRAAGHKATLENNAIAERNAPAEHKAGPITAIAMPLLLPMLPEMMVGSLDQTMCFRSSAHGSYACLSCSHINAL